MRLAPLLLAVTLSSGCAFAAAPVAHFAALPDGPNLDTPFTVQSNTQIPGKVLKPGGYTITMRDHLSDRAILQVTNDSGKVEATFLGVFNSGLKSRGGSGPIALSTEKGHDALRGFSFPGGRAIEFVYPKAEAAALATNSTEQVLAIDPASDNLRSSGKNLSSEDAQIVTLWSLQATRLSAGQKGIAAKKYVDPQLAQAEPAPAPTVARNTPPAPVAALQKTAVDSKPVVAKHTPAKNTTQVAANRIPAIKALPHTASNMPLLLLTAFGSFAMAAGMRIRRSFANAL